MRTRLAIIAAAALALAMLMVGAAAQAVTCRAETLDGQSFTVCEVDASSENLRLFLYDPSGAPFGDFETLQRHLEARRETLAFAMNAGMYHEDRSPVGHYRENGQETMRVIANAGPGNFGLLPNGILCITDHSARVIETRRFLATRPECRDATQSGPMLVIDGELHPRFLPESTSRFIRNGVGTSADGRRAVFAISDGAVTFHEFARLFRDVLKLPNALFFDGNVSRLFAPEIGRNDPGRRMGPIVAVSVPR